MLANPAMHAGAYPQPPPGVPPTPLRPDIKPPTDTPPGVMADVDSASENGENGEMSEMEVEKLDASHREILDKLKRQELEERREIERELHQVHHQGALLARHHSDDDDDDDEEELRAEDLRCSPRERCGSGGEERRGAEVEQLEIKTQRPLGLLAQHGMTTKCHSGGHAPLYDKDPAVTPEQREAGGHDSGDDTPRGMKRQACDDDDEEQRREEEEDRAVTPMTDKTVSEWAERGVGIDYSQAATYIDRAFMPSPPQPNAPEMLGASPSHHWTFEEQFKQLYELSDDAKRREFLDDLFAFMQKRGTPVNRIPIMAKQTLDLYELFRLVVAKGGLVDVINKKLWREITKGLNLPSSITSAAFTLRTQYMKYLYPYECDKMKLSSPSELQAAIDGNRREGRRPSYGYDFSPVSSLMGGGAPPGPGVLVGHPPPPPPPPHMPHMNGGLFNGRPGTASSSASGEDECGGILPPPSHLRTLAERDARAMEAAARAMEEVTKRMAEASRPPPPTHSNTLSAPPSLGQHPLMITQKMLEPPPPPHPLPLPLPPKRLAPDEEQRMMAHLSMPSAHLKITTRNDGRSDFDNSLVVSMEINGIMYQGVLFAQHSRRL